jgi:hypothetical protein
LRLEHEQAKNQDKTKDMETHNEFDFFTEVSIICYRRSLISVHFHQPEPFVDLQSRGSTLIFPSDAITTVILNPALTPLSPDPEPGEPSSGCPPTCFNLRQPASTSVTAFSFLQSHPCTITFTTKFNFWTDPSSPGLSTQLNTLHREKVSVHRRAKVQTIQLLPR